MALPGNVFSRVVGTPATPTFAEVLFRGYTVESNSSIQTIINQLHFARLSGPGTDTETDLLAAVLANVGPSLAAALSNKYSALDMTCRFMDDPTRAAVTGVNTIAGAIAGDRLPSFNAVVTRKKTYGRGRSYKGSNHWAPIAESDTDLDQLAAGAITRWTAVATALAALGTTGFTGTADTWVLLVLSPTLSDYIANPSLFSGSVVNDVPLNLQIGSMARRKQGVGI